MNSIRNHHSSPDNNIEVYKHRLIALKNNSPQDRTETFLLNPRLELSKGVLHAVLKIGLNTCTETVNLEQ